MFGTGGEPGPSLPVLLTVQSRSGVPPLQQQSAPFRQIAAQRVPVVPFSPAQSSLKKFIVHPVPLSPPTHPTPSLLFYIIKK